MVTASQHCFCPRQRIEFRDCRHLSQHDHNGRWNDHEQLFYPSYDCIRLGGKGSHSRGRAVLNQNRPHHLLDFVVAMAAHAQTEDQTLRHDHHCKLAGHDGQPVAKYDCRVAHRAGAAVAAGVHCRVAVVCEAGVEVAVL